MDLITDIEYCEAMSRAGLLGHVVQAWDVVGSRCDMAPAYVDSLRVYLESAGRGGDADAAFRVVADILKQRGRWRDVVITRAIKRATEVLKNRGLEFQLLPSDESVAQFYGHQIKPRLEKGDVDPLLVAAIWMQAHQHRDGPGNWEALAETCCRLLCELGDLEFYDRGHTEESLTCFELAVGLDPESEAALWGVTTVSLQGSPMAPEEAIPYQALLARVAPKRDEMAYVLSLAVQTTEGHGVPPEPGWSLEVEGLDRLLEDPLEPHDSDSYSVLEAKGDALARVVEAAEDRYGGHPAPENEQALLAAESRASEVSKRVLMAGDKRFSASLERAQEERVAPPEGAAPP